MTKEQFLRDFGDVPVKFYSYYKYTFTFRSTNKSGPELQVAFGGDAEDIYRSEVTDEEVTVRELDKNEGINFASRDGKVIYCEILFC